MSRPTRPKDRLEYLLFRTLVFVVRALPEAVANKLGASLGWLAGAVFRIRRETVDDNLRRAFPEWTEEARDQLAVASYQHLGREAVATFRTVYEDAAAVRDRTEVVGMDVIRDAIDSGTGCLLLTGHLGNWEMAGSAMSARGVLVDGIAHRQRNPLFDRELVRTRERLGMRIINKRDAARAIPDCLADGRLPAFVADQNAGPNGLFVDFFGEPASTARGAAYFALKTGARLFAGAALRVGTGAPARYRIVAEEISVESTGDENEDLRRITQAHTAALERWVRGAPEQYFWVHKRWKSRPKLDPGTPTSKPV